MTLVFVLCYGPNMISAAAVTLALAFWTPYNHGQPVCPDGVKVHQAAFGHSPGYSARWDDTGELIPQCEMWADPSVKYLPKAAQCAWVARNIGTGFMGLPSSTDRRNVMYARRFVVPAACRS